MYLEYFGLSEPPFRITPHTDFFFDGANRGATLDALTYAITHDEGIVKVSGEVGSGKTMLCRVLMERLPQNVTSIYLANPSLSREDILYAIADELQLNVPERTRLSAVLKALHDHLIKEFSRGRQVVVLIDEAHAMPAESLEEIRLLSNLESNRSKLLQLVLFGQPELNDTLARADMRQLKERITHNFVLEPLVRDDIAHYLDFRLRAAGYRGPELFTQQAVRHIARISQGLTRRINILADKALLSAFSAGVHQVGLREARRAAADSDFSNATYGRAKFIPVLSQTLVWGVLVVALLLVLSWLLLVRQETAREQSPPAKIAENEGRVPASPASPAAQSAQAGSAAPTHREATGSIPDATGKSDPNEKPPPQVTQPRVEHVPAEARPQEERSVGAQAQSSTGPPKDLGPRTRRALEDGAKWLDHAGNDRWFLQIYTGDGRDSAAVEDALRRIGNANLDMSKVRAYYSDLSGAPRFGIIFGEFDARGEAFAAIQNLPKPVSQLKPYPRQVIRLR